MNSERELYHWLTVRKAEAMLGFIIFLIWYSAMTVVIILIVTGGELAKVGLFAAGFITCMIGMTAVVALASAEVSGSRDE